MSATATYAEAHQFGTMLADLVPYFLTRTMTAQDVAAAARTYATDYPSFAEQQRVVAFAALTRASARGFADTAADAAVGVTSLSEFGDAPRPGDRTSLDLDSLPGVQGYYPS